ncbi:MAG: hypothetical protein KGI60_04720 [Patescibacteria group bacterium]|nr:hypothetical protein [Patescibacteria group bacterium]
MSPKDDFGLEHSIVESGIKKDFDVLELPLSGNAFRLILVGGLLFVGIAFARTAYLSFSQGNFYAARADMNITEPVTLPAIRGLVYDRYGVVLAQNEAAHRVVLNVSAVRKNQKDIPEIISAAASALDVPSADLSAIVSHTDFEKTALVTLERNVSDAQAAAVEKLGISELEIQDDYRREYPLGPAFAQVLGYTGMAQYGDLQGKTGLELQYNDLISGKDGMRVFYRSANGTILDEKLLDAPQQGADLHTTLDAGLQRYFYDRLKAGLRSLGRSVAVGIAVNPQTGEVLSLVNIPSYDNNAFTDPALKTERTQLLTAPFQPLFDRAVSGVYTPGSTVKPMEALAALKEGVITPQTQIYSAGYLDVPNPYDPAHPSRFLDWRPQGWVDVRSAIARSSDIFFYAVGGGLPKSAVGIGDVYQGLGIDKLKQYWQFFGLGQKTGIDLDGEAVGFLPDPQEKEAVKNDIWRIGDTYNVSIGQGDLQVTPIQLISQIASIANGGLLYQPYIGADAVGATGTTTIHQPTVLRDFSNLVPEIHEVQEGMKDTVRKPYGTEYMLADLPFTAAGKTGSSQVANNTKTNAFFVGYAPADHPQIAVLVLVEDALEGSLNAVPIGKDVLNWYYQNRIASTSSAQALQ